MKTRGAGCRGPSPGTTPLRFSLLEHLGDGCPGEDVMKLLKHQHGPVPLTHRISTESRHQISLPEQTLQGAVVSFLIGTGGCASPVQFQEELIPPNR